MRSDYAGRVWRLRHFWIHLAMSDLRSRWRRSYFGILWSVMQPLATTLMLSFVFGRIFHVAVTDYAPYVLSGMIVWDFVTASALNGAQSFVQADAYIKQCLHPLAIYPLRTVIGNLVALATASTGLIVWVLIAMPAHFGWSWLAVLTIFPILGLICWPLATLLAYFTVRFRDLPHSLGLVLQAMWFLSPIYFEPGTFRAGNLQALVEYNPIYHLLQIVRAPLLHGAWPSAENYAYCLAVIAVFALLAWLTGRRAEHNVIFYL